VSLDDERSLGVIHAWKPKARAFSPDRLKDKHPNSITALRPFEQRVVKWHKKGSLGALMSDVKNARTRFDI
jgi:hypothetical protein